jgi:hypothetical protein
MTLLEAKRIVRKAGYSLREFMDEKQSTELGIDEAARDARERGLTLGEWLDEERDLQNWPEKQMLWAWKITAKSGKLCGANGPRGYKGV